MNFYLVGGAVRDKLLELTVKDRDWVVTGATPAQLQSMGFQPVGRSFPIFLHPETHDEVALPRIEIPGASEEEMLIADLKARDLTINAIAMDRAGDLFDPLRGQQDIRNRVLRHTPGFAADPIRILRLARFWARFHTHGFKITKETRQLAEREIASGALNQLVAERVWQEIELTLSESQPWHFFDALHQWGGLKQILPELDSLFGVPQTEKHHPEIDSGIHTLAALEQACLLTIKPEIRFATLLHDLGKGRTPKTEWPRHIAHEIRGLEPIKALCERLQVPNRYRDLAMLVAQHHTLSHRALELRPKTLLKLLHQIDSLRQPTRLEDFLIACEADFRGRWGFENRNYPQGDYIRAIHQAVLSVDTTTIANSCLESSEITTRIAGARTQAIAEMKHRWITENHEAAESITT